MTVPSLRLIRRVRSVFSINTLRQPFLFNQPTARELCQVPTITERKKRDNSFERLVRFNPRKGPMFSDLPLHEDTKEMLKRRGFHRMSFFQRRIISMLLKETHTVILTETGCGKTLCYLVAIINAAYTEKFPKNTNRPVEPSVVILTPSRENGIGIYNKTRALLKAGAARVSVEFGIGKPDTRQTDRAPFLDGCDIFITSPVRLQELVKDNSMSLNGLKVLIVDDLGQIAKVMLQAIKQLEIKHPYQMIVVGSSVKVNQMISSIMPPEPVSHFRSQQLKAPKAISQHFRLSTDQPMSSSRLQSLLTELENITSDHRRGIIFCNTVEMVKCLESELYHRGFNTTPFHGEQKHGVRSLSILNFFRNDSQILVATAMGSCIDFTDVDFVINYELPVSVAIYLHQIGRCGRLSKPGLAVTFASREEVERCGYVLPLLQFNDLTEAKKLFFPNPPGDKREVDHPNSTVDEEENNNAELDKTRFV